MSTHRKLTDRQAAVLAAVERLGRPTMPELWGDLPDHAPSLIARVLRALEERGRIASAGNPEEIYLGGVRWWSTAFDAVELPETLAALASHLDAEAPELERWTDPHERAVGVLMPLADIGALLSGASAPAADSLRRALDAACAAGVSASLEVTAISARSERSLELRITAA